MEAPEIEVGPAKAGTAPFQYSLRTIFLVTTVLAVGLSGIFAGPDWLSELTGMFLGLTTPMVLTVGLIYGRGYVRTFCIGALFPASMILLGLIPGLSYFFSGMTGLGSFSGNETGLYVGIAVLVASILILMLGLVAMGVRWMVEAPHRRQQREASIPGETSQASGPEAPTAAEPRAEPTGR